MWILGAGSKLSACCINKITIYPLYISSRIAPKFHIQSGEYSQINLIIWWGFLFNDSIVSAYKCRGRQLLCQEYILWCNYVPLSMRASSVDLRGSVSQPLLLHNWVWPTLWSSLRRLDPYAQPTVPILSRAASEWSRNQLTWTSNGFFLAVWKQSLSTSYGNKMAM